MTEEERKIQYAKVIGGLLGIILLLRIAYLLGQILAKI